MGRGGHALKSSSPERQGAGQRCGQIKSRRRALTMISQPDHTVPHPARAPALVARFGDGRRHERIDRLDVDRGHVPPAIGNRRQQSWSAGPAVHDAETGNVCGNRVQHFLVEAKTGQPGHGDGAGCRYPAVPQVVGLDFPALIVAAAGSLVIDRKERAFMRVSFQPFSRVVLSLVTMDVDNEVESVIAGSAAAARRREDEPRAVDTDVDVLPGLIAKVGSNLDNPCCKPLGFRCGEGSGLSPPNSPPALPLPFWPGPALLFLRTGRSLCSKAKRSAPTNGNKPVTNQLRDRLIDTLALRPEHVESSDHYLIAGAEKVVESILFARVRLVRGRDCSRLAGRRSGRFVRCQTFERLSCARRGLRPASGLLGDC